MRSSVEWRGDLMSEREEQGGDGEVAECHVCGRTFPTQEDLSKHLIDEHDGETLGSN
jgi:hypothetical protein